MTIHLPEDLERYLHAQIQSGRFASENEAMTEAVRLLRQREEARRTRTIEAVRQGLEDMKAGKGRPADEVFDEIRREFDLLPDA